MIPICIVTLAGASALVYSLFRVAGPDPKMQLLSLLMGHPSTNRPRRKHVHA
jgi:hypothetical protein